jgi:ABC-2 type transport system permease protein
MNRIIAITRKELIHIMRDPRLLGMILMMPLIQLFLYAYALSFDIKHLPTAVLDFDQTAISRQYTNALEQSNYFTVNKSLKSYAEVDRAFETNADRVVVVISDGFGDELMAGRQGKAQVLVDGSDANSAQLGSAYASALSRIFGSKIVIAQTQAKGFDTAGAAGLSSYTRTWYNPEGRSASYFIPGLIVVLVTMVTVLQTSITLVREKENGTYEQLVVSPMRRIELMIGKVAPWSLIGAAQIVLISVIGIMFFQIPFRGSALLLGVASLLYVTCTLGLGLIVSARAETTDSAAQMAALISFLPTFMLSGYIFPITSMPWLLQALSYLYPARYFIAITRTIFLKGGGMEVLWPDMLALVIFAVAIISLAASLYRERA